MQACTCVGFIILLLCSITQFGGSSASALSSSDLQQVRDITRQELRNMFNPDHRTSNAISGEILDKHIDWINIDTKRPAYRMDLLHLTIWL